MQIAEREFNNKSIAEQIADSCSVLSNVSQNENEEVWLATRTKGIGGSDVGAICGVNNWSSALQIYLRKTGQFEEEHSEAAKERMHWGHMLEPVVADEFARNYDLVCEEAGCTFKSNKYPFLLANVDRFVLDPNTGDILGILECKTANEMMNDEWNSGEVPISYYYQVQHYLFVTGLKRAWISCLVGGNKFYTYDIFFDADLYTNVILPTLDSFWNDHVLKLQEPPTQAADGGFFDSIFTADKVVDEPINLEQDNADDTIGKILELKQQKKDIEKEIEVLQADIKKQLGEHTKAYSPSYEITWSPRTRTSVNSAKLRTEYPDIYEECLNTTSYRQMSIKEMVVND